MVYLDKYGWPVERVKGRWFFNLLRLIIHTRCIKKGRFKHVVGANKQMQTDANSRTSD